MNIQQRLESYRLRLLQEYGVVPLTNEDEDFLTCLVDHLTNNKRIPELDMFKEIIHQVHRLRLHKFHSPSDTFRGFRTVANTQEEIERLSTLGTTNFENIRFENLRGFRVHNVVIQGPIICEVVDFRNIKEPCFDDNDDDLNDENIEEGSIQEEILNLEEETNVGNNVNVRKTEKSRLFFLTLTNGSCKEKIKNPSDRNNNTTQMVDEDESEEEEEDSDESLEFLTFQAMEYKYLPNFEVFAGKKIIFKNIIVKRGVLMMSPRNTRWYH